MAVGARYLVNRLGKELKDPQTGQSLGRVESRCCDLVVTRVAENLSYGRLENLQGTLDDVPVGGLLVAERLADGSSSTAGAATPAAAVAAQPDGGSAVPAGRAVAASPDVPAEDAVADDVPAPAEESRDDKW